MGENEKNGSRETAIAIARIQQVIEYLQRDTEKISVCLADIKRRLTVLEHSRETDGLKSQLTRVRDIDRIKLVGFVLMVAVASAGGYDLIKLAVGLLTKFISP